MSRNRIQFEEGLSETRFATLYGSEDLCRAAIARWRWTDVFVYPACGGTDHCMIGRRRRHHEARTILVAQDG